MLVLNLHDGEARLLNLVGGKAASLAGIISLGIPSALGFCVTTTTYVNHFKQLWSDSQLDDSGITYQQKELTSGQLAALRSRLLNTELSNDLKQAIAAYYRDLAAGSKFIPLRTVVRSSATVEDLPGASFAGQYDTFINISDLETVLICVKQCWASFWKEGAYYYRAKKGYDHWKGLMGVIVQEMIPAEASGIMFTMNPVTRNKAETLIEACWGLGELIVSGKVTPDAYYVETGAQRFTIGRKTIGTKRRMLLPDSAGGNGTYEADVPSDKAESQVIGDQTILELARWGDRLAAHYKCPLDIEWAVHNGQLYILQARPVTVLGG
jgi:pyruvate, water dikinase